MSNIAAKLDDGPLGVHQPQRNEHLPVLLPAYANSVPASLCCFHARVKSRVSHKSCVMSACSARLTTPGGTKVLPDIHRNPLPILLPTPWVPADRCAMASLGMPCHGMPCHPSATTGRECWAT